MNKRSVVLIILTCILLSLMGCHTSDPEPATSMSIATSTPENTSTQAPDPSVSVSPDSTPLKLSLDKTYRDERFGFEVDYPSVWATEVFGNHDYSPDHGIAIYIDMESKNLGKLSIESKSSLDAITVSGFDPSYAETEKNAVKDTIQTNQGIKGTMYTTEYDGKIQRTVVFEESENVLENYVCVLYMEKDTYERYKDILNNIINSLRIKAPSNTTIMPKSTDRADF